MSLISKKSAFDHFDRNFVKRQSAAENEAIKTETEATTEATLARFDWLKKQRNCYICWAWDRVNPYGAKSLRLTCPHCARRLLVWDVKPSRWNGWRMWFWPSYREVASVSFFALQWVLAKPRQWRRIPRILWLMLPFDSLWEHRPRALKRPVVSAELYLQKLLKSERDAVQTV